MPRSLAIVAGTFGLIGLLGIAARIAYDRLGKKIERIKREQQKTP